jgi:hypothetical protein
MRLVLAVVTGYLVFAVSGAALFQLTQQDRHAEPGLKFAILSVVWGVLFAGFGGFVAARGAKCNAIWEHLAAMLLMAPSACAGGLIKPRRQS